MEAEFKLPAWGGGPSGSLSGLWRTAFCRVIFLPSIFLPDSSCSPSVDWQE